MIGRGASLVVWAVLGATLIVGQIVAVTSGGGRLGLGTFVRHLTGRRFGRVLVILGWMFLGWHAFAR
jgi:hypothetical protein